MAVAFNQYKDKEHQYLALLVKHFDWEKNECFPNTHLFAWEADLVVLTASNYVTEVEVKVSLSDWRADAKKDKFKDKNFAKHVKRFYYAVPEALYDQHLHSPVEIPEYAGVLVFRPSLQRFAEVLEADNRPGVSAIKDSDRQRLLRSLYFRYHRQFIKGIPAAPAQPKKPSVKQLPTAHPGNKSSANWV